MRHPSSLIDFGTVLLGMSLAACSPDGSTTATLDSSTGDSSTVDGSTAGPDEPTGTTATPTTSPTTGTTEAISSSGETNETTDPTTEATTEATTSTSTAGETSDTTTGTTGETTEGETDTGVAESIVIERIGRYAQEDEAAAYATYVDEDLSAAEIPAFDPASQRLFVVNGQKAGIDVLDLSDPAAPVWIDTLDTSLFGPPNSVSVHDGVVAAAVESTTKTNTGEVWFFDAATGTKLAAVGVGALPDMVTFSPDGNYVVTADEGEPADDYVVDPVGSVSVIDVSGGVENVLQTDVTTADFSGFTLMNLDPDVRLFGPNADSPAQNLEPEYVAISGDSKTAYVTLQENNALAVVDLASGTVTDVHALGFKAWNNVARLDPSDEDGEAALVHAPVRGMYQPDAIAWFSSNGADYLLTANEGDVRDWDGYSEEVRIKNLDLDPQLFPDADDLQEDAALGRLKVTDSLGDVDDDGDFDALYTFGGRSFAVWSAADATLVHDSGEAIEQLLASDPGQADHFNADNADHEFDSRSDDKGPEPEGLTLGVAYGRTLGFIGLERQGGVLMVDLADPGAPEILAYVNPRDFTGDPADGSADDLGPEGLTFVSAANSPNGKPLVIVANEVSGTVSIYQLVAE
ncbi:choice-of-anchor I family protein [Nannocystis radixulma]|uniref:Choice-of-anchor I family protein n=1 Tax=Nannocystis radixulma TaxID=2995305 RepID=A0ABT5AXR4_9BACT|nr:choice-of-anchor I family protein [Nannocystis radixulma]MDC0666628.1 choice-of-anchor I family protein [Nannocystis radixulma]